MLVSLRLFFANLAVKSFDRKGREALAKIAKSVFRL